MGWASGGGVQLPNQSIQVDTIPRDTLVKNHLETGATVSSRQGCIQSSVLFQIDGVFTKTFDTHSPMQSTIKNIVRNHARRRYTLYAIKCDLYGN